MEALTVRPSNPAELKVVKAFLKALSIDFSKAEEKSPYGPEFVEKMKRSEEDKKAGRGRKVTVQELSTTNESIYKPEFVEKIKRGDEAHERGDYKSIKVEDLWK